jgi:DNA-binding NarL/FixJ family response regulator
MVQSRQISVLLAVDQKLFREGLKKTLLREQDIAVSAEATDAEQALAEARRTRPEVAILLDTLPNGGGINATSAILRHVPECRVLIIGPRPEQSKSFGIAALEAGATGYITMDTALDQLVDATRSVYLGEIVIPNGIVPTLVTTLLRGWREVQAALRAAAKLTRRERQVLALVADGASNQRVARTLRMSPETARTHVQHILKKLGLHSRIELAAHVRNSGILDQVVEMDRLFPLGDGGAVDEVVP